MEDAAFTDIQERIRAAVADARPLRIRAGGTKDFYGEPPAGEPLDVGAFRGIVSYAPGELVVTARGGTPLAEVEDALDLHGQMLAFEPPRHGPGSTLGGVVASGLSGPRRPHSGAVRDFVLGVRVIDGTGTPLTFGGQVIKNVAGFDVSRVMTGALGTLGVLMEISLRCLPRPKTESTRTVECDGAEALRLMNQWGGKPLPITATCYHRGRLWIRLSGAPAAVAEAASFIGGDEIDGAMFWLALRDQTLDLFRSAVDDGATLWRLSVGSGAPWEDWSEDVLVEWGGALRWISSRTPLDPERVRAWSRDHGGHATIYRGLDKSPGVFQPLPAPLLTLHQRLKQVFDPHRVLNPGRMYTGI